MLGYRRLSQVQILDDISANTGVSAGQDPQNPNSSWVPERLGERSQLFVRLTPFDRT
jgi:hypothetical protein